MNLIDSIANVESWIHMYPIEGIILLSPREIIELIEFSPFVYDAVAQVVLA